MRVVRPGLQAGDAQAVADEVLLRWMPRQLCRLLGDGDVDVRRVAAVVLGLVGDRTCVGCMARALHDADEQVHALAEHGLWSIWFRSGKAEAGAAFATGVGMLEREAYREAVGQFDAAAALDPDFAEAHNQCGMAHFFLGEWQESVEACERALERMPAHFGAMAGMGHAYTQLERVEDALGCYRRALSINPRMPGIASAVERLEAKLGDAPVLAAVRAI